MEKMLLDFFEKNWNSLASAPGVFAGLIVISFALAIAVSNWYHAKTLAESKATIESLKERLILRAEQTEQYREKALKFDEQVDATVVAVVEATPDDLKQKALGTVAEMRRFLSEQTRLSGGINGRLWDEMVASNDQDQKHRRWIEMTNRSSQLGTDLNQEWDRRFKVDSLILRDELRSRVKDYVPDPNVDLMYEHGNNSICFEKVATDVELMAKLLG